jgi:hypothetical protein
LPNWIGKAALTEAERPLTHPVKPPRTSSHSRPKLVLLLVLLVATVSWSAVDGSASAAEGSVVAVASGSWPSFFLAEAAKREAAQEAAAQEGRSTEARAPEAPAFETASALEGGGAEEPPAGAEAPAEAEAAAGEEVAGEEPEAQELWSAEPNIAAGAAEAAAKKKKKKTKKTGKGLEIGQGWEGFGGGILPGAAWRPYAASSPFNQTTQGATVDQNSAAYVKGALSLGLPESLIGGTAETAEDWGHPVFYAQPGDPTYVLEATEPWGPNPIDGVSIKVPEAAQPAAGGDGHMSIVEPDGWEYDFWRAKTPPAKGGVLKFAWGGRLRIDGNGLEGGATAAAFGNLAGMIRAPELAAGKINHALFIVLRCSGSGLTPSDHPKISGGASYVYPATHASDPCSGSQPNVPPLGSHLMLAMSDAQIAALAVPEWKKTILTALAHYGGYVGDTGGPGFAFMFESSTTYTALGLPDPLVTLAKQLSLPSWHGEYAFEMAGGVEWAKYLRVLAPPAE